MFSRTLHAQLYLQPPHPSISSYAYGIHWQYWTNILKMAWIIQYRSPKSGNLHPPTTCTHIQCWFPSWWASGDAAEKTARAGHNRWRRAMCEDCWALPRPWTWAFLSPLWCPLYTKGQAWNQMEGTMPTLNTYDYNCNHTHFTFKWQFHFNSSLNFCVQIGKVLY